MSADNGGSAFPSHGTMGEIVQDGMTLRDYFAAKAIHVLIDIGVNEIGDELPAEKVAEMAAHKAYQIADAMLAERAK